MLRGFWKLSWVEIKVFAREPMGAIGSLLVPVLLFVMFGRVFGAGKSTAQSLPVAESMSAPPFNVAIAAALLMAIGAVLSLIAIISIYREGGILKRLRATPLSPVTILGSHVVVKLIFTVIGMALLTAAGKRSFPGLMSVNIVSFTAAVLLSTVSILSLGFVIASIVPTARFAQPIGATVLYPMVAMSGLFYPLDRLPPSLQLVARLFPTTHAVQLLQGVWDGSGWSAHLGDVGALIASAVVCIALATRVFRWE